MASSAITRGEKNFGLESEEPDRGNPRRNGRRRSKASEAAAAKKKKMPQRGMGVAELERLRVQERDQMISPIQAANNHYFITPFTGVDPVPVGAPVKFPMINPYGSGNNGFRQTGCNPNAIVPWHYSACLNHTGISKDHQLSSIRGSVCVPDLCGFCIKKKRTNDDVGFCWNKSLKDVTFNTPQKKERMEERGDLVMHQFFPAVGLRLELGLEASTAAAGGDDDDDGDDDVIFRSTSLMINNSVDLSLKL